MPSRAVTLQSWRVRIFFAAWVTYCAFYICRKAALATLPGGTREEDLSTVIFVFSLAYGLGQICAGTVTDRLGGRVTGFAGAVLASLSTASLVRANSMPAIFALLAGCGLGQGCGFPAICKMFGAWFRREERGVVLAWWSTSYSLGGFIATAMTAALVSWNGHYALLIPACILMLVGAVWLFSTRDRPELVISTPAVLAPATESIRWPALLQNREIHLLAGMYFFLKLARYSLLFWLPFYLVQSLKYSPRYAAYTASLFELIGFSGMLAAGYVSDRWLQHRRYPVGASMLLALSFVCLLHPVLNQFGWGATALGISLMGILIYGPDILMTGTAVLDAVPPAAHGRATAYVNGIGSLGQMVSPLIVSIFVRHFGWDSLFNICVGCSAIAAGLLGLKWNQQSPDESSALDGALALDH